MADQERKQEPWENKDLAPDERISMALAEHVRQMQRQTRLLEGMAQHLSRIEGRLRDVRDAVMR